MQVEINENYLVLGGFLLTSSSLHACNMILFGWFDVMPECPFDQSYEIAYAKMVPVRLKHVAETGPGAGSKAKEALEGKYLLKLLAE